MNKNKRDLLKGIAVGPAWVTPVVSSVVIPAHAQTTTCVEWALTLERLGASGGGVHDSFVSEDPDLVVEIDLVRYWSCDGDCIFGYVGNADTGTASWLLTIFGTEIPVVASSFSRVVFALNRETLAWDTSDSYDAIDWGGIGCPQP